MAVFLAASDGRFSAASRALAKFRVLGEVGLVATGGSGSPAWESASPDVSPRRGPSATPSASRTSSNPRSCMNSSRAPGVSGSESESSPSPATPASPPSSPGATPSSPTLPDPPSRNRSRLPSNGRGSSVVGTPSGSTTTSWPWESCNPPEVSAGGSVSPPNPPSGHHAGRSAMAVASPPFAVNNMSWRVSKEFLGSM